MDQLLCLPLPLMPSKGFSCSRQTRPWRSAFWRLHDQHVVVNCQVQFLEDGGQLKLRGGHLVVAGLGGDAQAPELLLHIGHEGQDAIGNAAEVVVFQLLVLGGRCTVEGAPGLQQVGALQVELLVHQEVFLLGAQSDRHRLLGQPEALHQTDHGLLQGLRGA